MTLRLGIALLLGVPELLMAQLARSSRADSLYLAGRRHLSGGQYEQAIHALDQVSQLEPERKRLADAHYWLAFSLYHVGGTGNMERAAQLLAAAIAGGGTHHPDAVALLTRVRARLGRAPAAPNANVPCPEPEDAVAAERLSGLASQDPPAARVLAEAVLRAPTRCGELVRRTAVIILGRASDPERFVTLRFAAEHDASSHLRVDALHRLRPDSSPATMALMLRLASRPHADLVTLAAASHLASLRTPNADQALVRFLADTTVPLGTRQVALSHLRLEGTNKISSGMLRALLPKLAGGSAQSTLVEVLVRQGDAGDRDWVWSVVLDESAQPLTRLTGLQHLGSTRRASELAALFDRTSVRLVRYGVVEQLRNHQDPAATSLLRRLLSTQQPGPMHDAIAAALASGRSR